MRKVVWIACGLSFLALIVLARPTLKIRVAPSTLVLSSHGGKLTVHADVKFSEDVGILLEIDGTEISPFRTFPDDRGNLVVQAKKRVVAKAIGDFEGNFTKAEVALTVDGVRGTATIVIRK